MVDPLSKVPDTFFTSVLSAVFLLVFTPLAVTTWRQARSEWRTVASEGVVVGIRTVKYDRPLPRARGPWHVVWVVECSTVRAERVSVTALGSYSREVDAEEAARDDRGRRVTVWHVPGSGGPGSLSPPAWERSLFAAIWTTAMAAIGWVGAAALGHRAWQKFRRRQAEARAARFSR